MTKTIAALCAVLLTLTACGGGDDEAKENIKESLLENGQDFAGTELTEEEATCLSDGMVDEIGTDQLQEIGLLDEDNNVVEDAQPDDLAKEDADALADTIVECVDVQELMAEQMGPMMEQMDEEQQECITDAFDDETIVELISASFQGEEPDTTKLQETVMECVGPGAG
jgi:hypothetical protein